jgi:hypothetical protein
MTDVIKTASISDCGRYRTHLGREFATGQGMALFVMLNPSKADADLDDPTIRKCMRFAQRWGYRELEVVNLFAWRDTSPEAMKAAADPVGHDYAIYNSVVRADIVICAWGKHGSHLGRADAVLSKIARSSDQAAKLHYLVLNLDGSPRHPLYVPDATKPTLWERR